MRMIFVPVHAGADNLTFSMGWVLTNEIIIID
jgi:hypothetical protein